MKMSLLRLGLLPALWCAIPAFGVTHYVDLNCTHPLPPYTDWTSAATNIQDALDTAGSGDLVLVTNGVYAAGGGAIDAARVAITNSVTLRSVNGPSSTVIDGGRALRCAALADGAVLAGFTLANGYAIGQGGGVLCSTTNSTWSSALVVNCLIVSNSATYQGGGVSLGTVSNCTLAYNFVYNIEGGGVDVCQVYRSLLFSNSAPRGGGCAWSTLDGCILLANTGRQGGGGAFVSDLNNCLVISNSSPGVGGALGCDLTNCTVCANSGGSVGGVADSVTPPAGSIVRNSILYYNSPANWSLPAALAFTCATPLSLGTGNFSNAPRFLDAAGGDFHLATNSPCINAGSNALVHGNTDCDGYPRIAGNTVDLGAYEVQAPASLLSYAWAEQYGLDTDGSADFTDPDGDGLNNWQEWIAGTNPTNALSVLRMTSASKGVNGSLILGWQSVNTRSYFLQRATSPGSPPAFSTVQSNLAGVAGTTFYTDAAATNGGPYFYRVGVQ